MKINFYKLLLGTALSCSLFNAHGQTYTFTPCGATGPTGPTQLGADTTYLGTTLDGAVTVVGGIQYWVVPSTGNYRIEAYGGQGYGDFGGRGAQMIGDFLLNVGDTMKILVGHKAPPYLNYPSTTYNHQFGGGGGSFVTTTADIPYIVAGGGGGNHGTAYVTTCDGQITTDGASGANGSTVSAGGTGGNGGQAASSADAGGGLLTNGAGLAGGFAFVNGGNGGADEGIGGFGCGGGTSSWNNYRGGGGGGYSGGGAGNYGGTCCPAGGGGGSYNSGTNQNNLAGVQLGDGLIVISNLCNPTVLTADVVLLSDLTDECTVTTPVAPTATNDCGIVIQGVPDVAFPISMQGTTVVTWTYDDGTNVISQTQNVVIADVTGPTPDSTSLPDSTYWCSVESLIVPTATDNCSGLVTVTNNVTLPITTGGLTVVTWTYTDESGNTTTQDQNITLDVIDNGISQNGDMLFASMAGYNYQWVDCDNGNAPISGEINQFYTPTTTGNYAVQVMFNGCTDISSCIFVDLSGLEDLNGEVFSVYPNPSNDGNFVVQSTQKLDEIRVYDAQGREVQVDANLATGSVNGSQLDPGKYIVKVVTEKSSASKAIVILK